MFLFVLFYAWDYPIVSSFYDKITLFYNGYPFER